MVAYHATTNGDAPNRNGEEPDPEPTSDPLAARVRAVERALVDGEPPGEGLASTADLAERVEAIEDRLSDLDDRLADLEAGLQAVRGYIGEVKAVNDAVEDRASTAIDRTETMGNRLDALEQSPRQRDTSDRDPNGRGRRSRGGPDRVPPDSRRSSAFASALDEGVVPSRDDWRSQPPGLLDRLRRWL